MPRINDIMQPPPGTYGAPNTTIKSAAYNTLIDDLIADANNPRPVSAGGTGAQTPDGARERLGADDASNQTKGTLPTARLPTDLGRMSVVGHTMHIKADADANSHLEFQSGDGKRRGLLYWERNSGSLNLRPYEADGSAYGTTFSVKGDGISWNGVASGNGSGLTALNASNVSSGTLNDARLPGTMSGKTFTGNVSVKDGSQLNVYDLVGGGRLTADGSGSLYLHQINGSGGYEKRFAEFARNGGVGLYFNGSEKLKTTAAGASVTGTLAADAFSGNGSGVANVNAALLGGQNGSYYRNLGNASGNLDYARLPNVSGEWTYTGADSLVIRTLTNGSPGDPIFQVKSSGGAVRLEVQHDGVTIGDGFKASSRGFEGDGSKLTGVDASKLQGAVKSTGSSSNTIAQRDNNGDLSARLFRMEYGSNNVSPTNFVTVEAPAGGDNYLRPTSTASVVSHLAANGLVPEGRAISAGTGLSGGGNLAANRTISVDGTVWRDGNMPTAAQLVSRIGTEQVYTGSDPNNTNFPIGTTLSVVGGEYARNTARTVKLHDTADYSIRDNEGTTPLAGTWRVRGRQNSGNNSVQRVG